jgi:predicted anti-sigma-YlaC factor YlaD
MTCDEVREQLAEHLLGSLETEVDAAVRAHVRACASCRAEMAALAEGVSTLAAAAHDVEPPKDLRDRVLTVLQEEWSEAPLVRAAGIAALVSALAWGGLQTIQAGRYRADAEKYRTFLLTLGGEDVRVGELAAPGSQDLHGSVVIYDSKVGQSWVVVLCRAPGWQGSANVTMVADDGQTIELRPMEFGPGGEGSTWLATASDLSEYHRVNVWDEGGTIATARVERS